MAHRALEKLSYVKNFKVFFRNLTSILKRIVSFSTLTITDFLRES